MPLDDEERNQLALLRTMVGHSVMHVEYIFDPKADQESIVIHMSDGHKLKVSGVGYDYGYLEVVDLTDGLDAT